MKNLPKIIICTEKGKLEEYSILLCRSIRKYGGKFSDIEIFSFAPRKGFEPKKETLKEFKKLGVKHQNIVLNNEYRSYPLANKPLVCAYVEEKNPNQDVVFIDSDQIIFNQPNDFRLTNACDIILRPVDRKGVGFSSEKDPEYQYWQKLMGTLKFDFEELNKVETSNCESIYPYFNSGLIITNTKFGLFKKWKENFELVWKNQILPNNGLFFLEQSVFTATVLQMKMNFKLAENTYNYPFCLHDEVCSKVKLNDLSLVVTAHYHDMFVEKNTPDFFHKFSSETERGIWLKEQINDLGIKPDSAISKLVLKVKRKLLK